MSVLDRRVPALRFSGATPSRPKTPAPIYQILLDELAGRPANQSVEARTS